ncbi:MAG TPA: hypothetical protein VNX68_00490 [Nitrosopumilaceae archaeon]|jgi:hypothetical protein|nr:hypothetical protein [Nitrosopumilaceae archaeon]
MELFLKMKEADKQVRQLIESLHANGLPMDLIATVLRRRADGADPVKSNTESWSEQWEATRPR